jgi:hypothetical protein
MKKDFLMLTVLVLIGLFSRLLPHDWNFTAIGAISILAGLLISNKYLKFAVPLAAMVLSDIVIGFHNTIFFVYVGFILMTVVATFFSDAKIFQKVFLVPMVSSLVFFFVSNFGVWFVDTMYTKSISGLMECFMMGIPFYQSQFTADMILTPVLFYTLTRFLNFSFLFQGKSA